MIYYGFLVNIQNLLCQKWFLQFFYRIILFSILIIKFIEASLILIKNTAAQPFIPSFLVIK